MERGVRSHRTCLAVLLLCAAVAGLACSDDGDDGAPGAQGAQGPAGPPGAEGPPGDSGGFDPDVAIEAGVGCHGDNSAVPVGDITTSSTPTTSTPIPMGPRRRPATGSSASRSTRWTCRGPWTRTA